MISTGRSRHSFRRASTKRLFIFLIILSALALVFAGGAGAKLKAAFFQNGDIGVTKTGPATANADTDITFTIDVFAAAGQDDIASASLSDFLPSGTTFVSVAPPAGWSCSDPGVGNGGTVTCTNATLPAGSNDTFTLTAHISPETAPGTFLTNIATVGGSPNDFDENDTASATTQVAGSTDADISITKTGPSQVHANTDVAYVLTVKNLGPNDATNASFTDTLPSGSPSSPMTFVSFNQTSGATWNCPSPSTTTTCTIATLAAGATATFDLVGHVPNGTSDGTQYTNIANVNSDHDPNSENNSAVAGTTVSSCFTGQIVTTNADSGAGSLRQAILEACDGSTIYFDMSQVVSPITLTSGALTINKNLTIQGPGAPVLTISGANTNQVFNVTAGTVAISDLTISNGKVVDGLGGGIRNLATLALTNVTVSGNSAITFMVGAEGGGIGNFGTLSLTNSIVSGNSAGGGGGGILNQGTLTLSGTTVNGNTATLGGGILNNGGTVNLTNSTVSGNSSTSNGGGIFNTVSSTMTVLNSTITNNRSDFDNSGGEQGGGIWREGGTVTLKNTIVAGNFRGTGTTRDDAGGAVDATSSFNLIGDGTNMTGITNGSNGNQVGSAGAPINPLLAPLANYGGPTQTHALLPGSPAINAGSNTLANNEGLTTDQRGAGFSRIVNGTVDIGAFESSGFILTATSGTPQNTTIGTAFPLPLIASIVGFGSEPVNGGVVTFTAPGSGPSATLTGGTTIATVTIAAQASTNATANTVAGSYSVNVAAVGANSAAFNLTNNKGNTATTVTSSKNPSFFTHPVTFTATVSAVSPAPGTPTGTVTFLDAGNSIGTAPLVGGVATFTTSALTIGNHTITTSYNGDGNFNGSAGSLTGNPEVVNNPNTTTAITSSVNPSDLGQPVTFTAVVSAVQPSAGTPTGTVQFKDNGNNLGVPVTLNGAATAQFTTSSLTTGNHSITADYSGDGNFLPSSGTLAGGQTVRFRPLIKFSQPTYSVNELGNSVVITVVRFGDTTPAVTVDYTTPDDSAALTFLPCSNANGVGSPRCDFTTALGTLKFAPGETNKTFTVLISQDSWIEGDETVPLTLSNPTGGAAFQQPSDANAVLTIIDVRTPPITNMIDDSSTFVRQHYHDFLNREPDAAGFSFWTNQIESCGTDAQCRAVRRVNVSAAFFLSIEFQNTGYFVYRMYKAGFGDIAPPTVPVPIRFTKFLLDTQIVETGLIVGQGNWQAQLDANKKAYALAFVQRQEFLNRYPGLTSAQAFVDTLNANAGMVLSDSERSALIKELSVNPSDPVLRADVLQKVAENALLQQREFNRAFVLMEYLGYLRRNPDAAPEPGLNFNGFNFWLNKLNQFNGDYIDAEVIKAFINSSEYRGRFGP